MKTALIFGITGQDGSYLAELLLAKQYKVIGVARRTSSSGDERIRHLRANPLFRVVPGDVTDAMCVYRLMGDIWPDEVYNLAAQSHVRVSFDEPSHSTDVDYKGCLNILEAMRTLKAEHEQQGGHWCGRQMCFYQASSSEMFGNSYSTRIDSSWDCQPLPEKFQCEGTPFLPNSPYAIAKLACHHLVRVYRESYGLFACSGILFNHESERRGVEFVTRKITRYLGELVYIYRTTRDTSAFPVLKLGNLAAYRDWGHAEDYVRAMWLMMQQAKPDDFVIATGKIYSVKDFAVAAFKRANCKVYWETDPELFRPCEVPYLCGDASKAKRVLGWKPEICFEELVNRMVDADIGQHK